ncbi:DUF5801 repeats-in-toxin domain-containing protein [Psychromonas aquatilis]|uniref:DUF5801 repeats-in-toxin domain-containing protein n=1 Tax=Psychromonas aquatilis TaxID=2005072 RepID=A0ABU9GT93_9GAMM
MDTSKVTLSSNNVEEGTDITITATVDNAPKDSDLVLYLNNGEQITIAVGQTEGRVTFDNPNGEDVYVDKEDITYQIIGSNGGGNYEALDTSSTTTVIVEDTSTEAVVTLSDSTVAEGSEITITATVTDAPQNSDLLLTLDNGQFITITAGQTTGSVTFANPNTEDVYLDGETLTYAITSSTGGNYENLNTDAVSTVTVTDTLDTTTITLDNPTVAEGTDITITASVDNAPVDTPLVVTLDNGETITIDVGATTGSVTFANPNGDDAYVDGEDLSYTIDSATGGNYEEFNSDATSTVTVIDTTDTSTVTLSSNTVEEGTDINITATVDNAPENSDLVLYLNNGEQITIAVGQTEGRVTFDNPNGEDVYIDKEGVTYQIIGSNGAGNYEKLDFSNKVSVEVVDTINNVYAQISVDQDSVFEGGALTYTVNLIDENGDEVTVAADKEVTINLNWGGVADSTDVGELPTSIIINANSSEASFTVSTNVDSLSELSESLTVSISSLEDNDGVDKGFENLLVDAAQDSVTSTIFDAPTITAVDINGSNIDGQISVYDKGVGDNTDDSEITDGTLKVSAATGLISISIAGTEITLAQLNDLSVNPQTVVITDHGEIMLNNFTATSTTNGEDVEWEIDYTYELTDVQSHPEGEGVNDLLNTIQLTVEAENIAGVTSPVTGAGTLDVLVIDDVPVVTTKDTELDAIQVAESAFGVAASADYSDAFMIDFGADGAAVSGNLEYSFEVTNSVSGLVDTETGEAIDLVISEDGAIEGQLSTSGDITFIITVDVNGTVQLEQLRAIQHSDSNSANDIVTLANDSINLVATATDGDADKVSSTVAIGGRFSFADEGPSIGGTPVESYVDEEHLDNGSDPALVRTTVSENLAVDFGSDAANTLTFTEDQSALNEWLNTSGNSDITLNINGDTITATRNDGNDPVFTVTLSIDNEGQASYSFELQGAMQHLNTNTHSLTFNYQATDGDNDSATSTFVVNVTDDAPVAEDNDNSGTDVITGNVITDNVGTDDGVDIEGADTATVTEVSFDGTTYNVPTDGASSLVIQATYGELTIYADGSYEYVRNDLTPGDVEEEFEYTLTDGDNDSDHATLTIGIDDAVGSISNLTPEVGGGDTVVYENQLINGTDTITPSLVTGTGDFTISSADGIAALNINHNGEAYQLVVDNITTSLPVTFTTALGNQLSITGYEEGVVSYTYTLIDNETHSDAGIDNLFESFEVYLEDMDGDSTTSDLSVRIVDDIPVIKQTDQVIDLSVDETSIEDTNDSGNTDTADLSVLFEINHGADGAAITNATSYQLAINAVSGLVDTATNSNVVLTINSDGTEVIGKVDGSGETVFTIVLDPVTGDVSLTQVRAVEHADTNNANDAITLNSDAVTISATVIDGDNDEVISSVDIGDSFNFLDDGPSIEIATTGATLSELVTNDVDLVAAASSSDTKDFSGAFAINTSSYGADGEGTTVWSYAIAFTDIATGLTSGGEAITLSQSGNIITGSAGGNSVFTIEVNALTGEVTLTQTAAIDHVQEQVNQADFSDDQQGLLAELITLTGTATITDGDGDSLNDSETINIGGQFTFTDDGPTIGVIEGLEVNEKNLGVGSDTDMTALTQTGSLEVGLSADDIDTQFASDIEETLEALTLMSNGVELSYEVSGYTLTATAGSEKIFTATITDPNATNSGVGYSFVLLAVLDHPNGNDDNAIDLSFDFVVTDTDGDKATSSFTVSVIDDTPTVLNQAAVSVLEGADLIGYNGTGWTEGTSNLLDNDTQGADTAQIYAVRYNDENGDQQSIVLGNATQTITTQYASLTINPDGSWSYQADPSLTHTDGKPLSDLFSYTIQDNDGDISDWADQPINVTDSVPVAVDEKDITEVEGAASFTGNVIGNDTLSSDDDVTTINDFTYTDVNGDTQIFEFTLPTTSTSVMTPTGLLTVNSNGEWSFEPNDSFDHDNESTTGSFSYHLIDDDGSISNSAIQDITITDTDPTINKVELAIDEENIVSLGSTNTTETNIVTTDLDIVKSQDDIEDVAFNNNTITTLTDQGLTSGSTDLTYTLSDDGHTLTADANGTTVFVLQLNNINDAAGEAQSISMTLSQPLDHAEGATENNMAIKVDYAVSDIDSTVNSSLTINVTDDVPLTPVNDIAVTVVEGGSVVGSDNMGDNLLANDILGADGGAVKQISYTARDGSPKTAEVPADEVGVTVETQYGSLTVKADGSWSYTAVNSADHEQPDYDTSLDDSFTYQVIDNDGDLIGNSATQVITVTDTVPEFDDVTDQTVDEKNLVLGTDPDEQALTVTGSLSVDSGEDDFVVSFDNTIAGSTTLTSNGVAIKYVISDNGSTLIAYRDNSLETEEDKVFTVNIIDGDTANASYEFTLNSTIDHTSTAPIELGFDVIVTDSDNDIDSDSFTITVIDDVPADQVLVVNEDSDQGDEGNTFNTSADANANNTNIATQAEHGEAVVNSDGTITYIPNGNYSGSDSFTYQTIENGVTSSTTVNVTVTPVSDAPEFEANASSVSTLEDTAVALGFKTPVIVDATDNNDSDTDVYGDNPELLGVITLTGIPQGVTLIAAEVTGSAAINYPSTGAAVTVFISDGTHINGAEAEADLVMTLAQFEALQVIPAENDHTNFTVNASVTSYEVDLSGDPIDGVAGAENSTEVLVYVKAVTDDAELLFNGEDASSIDNIESVTYDDEDKTAKVTVKEDTSFKINDILKASFTDLDGSEVRSITFENNTGEVIFVRGREVGSGDSLTINSRQGDAGQTGGIDSFKNITIGAGSNFSGDLEGINITINAQDYDADGFNDNNAGKNKAGVSESNTDNNSVTLNLYVDPVADQVTIESVNTEEDTAVLFLNTIQFSDTGEEVTGIVINALPSDWILSNAEGEAVFTGNGLDGFTIPDSDIVNGDYASYTITPPAHSSADSVISISVETTDTQIVDGEEQQDSTITKVDIDVTVTSVAEELGVDDNNDNVIDEISDTDGDNVADLTMSGDHEYSTTGLEDTWFDLGTDGSESPLAGWVNQDADGSEATFALFTPISANGEADGAQFRYTTDNGATWVTQTYTGTAIEVPIDYLDTLEFKASKNFSGTFEIQVQAYTVDTDPETGIQSEWTSSTYATLTNILISPVADVATTVVSQNITGTEDVFIPLSIVPSSSDSSEEFNVTISDIPEGATIRYDGQEYTDETPVENLPEGVIIVNDDNGTWSLEIDYFDPVAGKAMEIKAPENSNDSFTLKIDTETVDTLVVAGDPDSLYEDTAEGDTLYATVRPKGAADHVTLELVEDPTYSEADVDNDGYIMLNAIVTGFTQDDNDGSEVVSFTISDLPDGFSIEGASSISEGVWSVMKSQYDDIKLTVPENYNSDVEFTLSTVSTENDGDTLTESNTISLTITPSPEATINLSTVIDEDVSTALNFAVQTQNGDTDEVLDAVWINIDSLEQATGISLTYGQDGITLAEAALDNTIDITEINDNTGNWYLIEGEALANIYAQSADNVSHYDNQENDGVDIPLTDFEIKYEIKDPGLNGGGDQTTITDDTYHIDITPITDQPTLAIVDTEFYDSASNTINVDNTGNLTIDLDIGNIDEDYDGSEELVSVVIEGIPDGVAIDGADYLGDGKWLIQDEMLDQIREDYTLSIDFDVSASAIDSTLTITINTEDGNNGVLKQAQISDIDFNIGFDKQDRGNGAADIDSWESTDFNPTEDTPFKLSDAISGSISTVITGADGSTVDVDVNSAFNITIYNLPAGTTVEGMTSSIVDGEEVWTLSGTGGNDDLQAAMDSIVITPPADYNYTDDGEFEFNATLTTINTASGAQTQVDEVFRDSTDVEVVPVTDQADIVIDAPSVYEGASEPLIFTIDVSNAADDPDWTLIDGKLYIQLDESGMPVTGGTLSYNGDALSTTAVTGIEGITDGDYYVIEDVDASSDVTLSYLPSEEGENSSGSVSISVTVQGQETGADNIETTTVTGTGIIEPSNSGYDFEVADATGLENEFTQAQSDGSNVIQLDITDNGLIDDDGSESLNYVLLTNVPNDFLVFIGDSLSSATEASLATNAGGSDGTNSWLISTTEMPNYIGIMAPAYWSGEIIDLELIVNSGENGADSSLNTAQKFDLTVSAVADGVTLSPTTSFGNEGNIIGFNLNPLMVDPVDVGSDDSSVETVTLQFSGVGEYAEFFVDGVSISTGDTTNISYDAQSETYTITGLTENQVTDLGVLQSAAELGAIQVRAQTVESDGGDTSEWTEFKNITVNVTEQLATSADNSLLYDGNTINGLAGSDTINLRLGEDLDFAGDADGILKNIEVINLGSEDYDHNLDNLSLADIQAMTDNENILTIEGDSGDSVTLLKDNNPFTSGWTLDDSDADYNVYTLTALSDDSILATVNVGKGVVTSIEGYQATTGDDVFVFDSSSIDGLDSTDTIQLRLGESVSSDQLASSLNNIEILDLSIAGENKITALSLDDVLSMTDGDNILTINGDANDHVSLSSVNGTWSEDVANSNEDYTVYTSTDGSDTATLQIQTSIIID